MPKKSEQSREENAGATNAVGLGLAFVAGLAVAGIAYFFSKATPQTQAQTAVDHTERTNACAVCFEKEINCALFPCKHYVLCSSCAARVDQCPICRTTIVDRQIFYNP